jgi:hypothetical protein
VDGRKSTKLPEGVGKKIVEALKKQSGAVNKLQPDEQGSSFDDLINSHLSENDSNWADDYQESAVINANDEYEDETFDNSYEVEEDSAVEEFKYHEVMDEDDLDSYEYYKNNNLEELDETEEEISSEQDFDEEENLEPETYIPEKQSRIQQKSSYAFDNQQQQTRYSKERSAQPRQEASGLHVETSSNIEVLMNLVSQLPSGVTRQTGAQIIRQTMEAIGFSMNKVLKEAQFAQDELGQAIRDNINTIEEYRNNIKILEKDVQKYRRKAEELEDLISLFILSEKERKIKKL